MTTTSAIPCVPIPLRCSNISLTTWGYKTCRTTKSSLKFVWSSTKRSRSLFLSPSFPLSSPSLATLSEQLQSYITQIALISPDLQSTVTNEFIYTTAFLWHVLQIADNSAKIISPWQCMMGVYESVYCSATRMKPNFVPFAFKLRYNTRLHLVLYELVNHFVRIFGSDLLCYLLNADVLFKSIYCAQIHAWHSVYHEVGDWC